MAADAWACVPQPRLVAVLPHASGPSGMEVTVQGVGFDPPPSRTEIRWNSPDGPELGRAERSDFAVRVVVPDVPAGLYGILVMSRGADGVLGNAARATFDVRGPAAVAAPTPAVGNGTQSSMPRANAAPATAPGPTFAPAVVAEGSSGPSGLTLGLAAAALLALGVFVGTYVTERGSGRDAASEGQGRGGEGRAPIEPGG